MSERIRRLQPAFSGGKRRLLMCALVAGDPHVEATQKYMHILADAGADIIELIVPFSDPTYHGAVIQRACARAIHEDVDWDEICAVLEGFRVRHPDTPVVVSTYYNRVLARGMDGCAKQLAEAGADAMMITDLPWDESEAVKKAFGAHGLSIVNTVAPTTSLERFRLIAGSATGLLVWTGHSGGELTISSEEFQRAMAEFRRHTSLPILASMKISTGEEAAEVGRYADGVLVGSALIWLIEGRGPDIQERLRRYVLDMREHLDRSSTPSP
ncbi:MAG: tryptophan synthase subunit alpha [Bradymonadaceae bacterium]